MTAVLEHLKKDIDDILTRYNVPMDDRLLIIEKIDKSSQSMIGNLRDEFDGEIQDIQSQLSAERELIKKQVVNIHRNASSKVGQIKDHVGKAYKDGFMEGMNQGSKSSGPSFFQVTITMALVALAGIIIFKGLFKG